MKTKKPNAEQIWKQLEDLLVPRLRLSTIDRAVYSHLLRHTRLEGRARLRFSIAWLARAARLSTNPVRNAVRRLADYGVLRLIARTKSGHVVEVRLPKEIRAARATAPLPRAASLGDADFMKTRALRMAIHARDRGLCFYCLRRLTPGLQTLDHVVPRVQLGRNSPTAFALSMPSPPASSALRSPPLPIPAAWAGPRFIPLTAVCKDSCS